MTETPTLIGYARVSTEDQNLQLQFDALTEAGVDLARIYQEKRSGASVARRPELRAALKDLRAGDTLVVWKLDRLGRNLSELIATVRAIEAKGADFRCLTQPIDTRTSMGRLVFNIFGAMAEFERDLGVERTKAGLAAARAQGRKGGRKFAFPPEVITEARRLMREEGMTAYGAGRKLGIKPSTVSKWKALLVDPPFVDDPSKEEADAA